MNPAAFTLRVMQIAFIVSVALFYFVGSTLHPAAQAVSRPVQSVVALCAICSALMGFLGQKYGFGAPNPSRPAPLGSTALKRWFAGHILRFATAESVALFGLVLRALGGPSTTVYMLFGASLLLLLLWQPGKVPTAAQSNISSTDVSGAQRIP
jgi:hypothetical protein